MQYITLDKDNNITAVADWQFPDSIPVDYKVVRGYDGRFYKEGEEPVKSDEQIKEELFLSLRTERDKRLSEFDYMFNSDYPDSEFKEKVKAYRQALRDLPSHKDSPWDGGKENTPFPEKPEK